MRTVQYTRHFRTLHVLNHFRCMAIKAFVLVFFNFSSKALCSTYALIFFKINSIQERECVITHGEKGSSLNNSHRQVSHEKSNFLQVLVRRLRENFSFQHFFCIFHLKWYVCIKICLMRPYFFYSCYILFQKAKHSLLFFSRHI